MKAHEILRVKQEDFQAKMGSYDEHFLECLCVIAKVIDVNFKIFYANNEAELAQLSLDLNASRKLYNLTLFRDGLMV